MNSDKTPKETHEKLKFSKKIHFIRTIDFSPISRRHWNSSKTEFWSETPSALRNDIIYLLNFLVKISDMKKYLQCCYTTTMAVLVSPAAIWKINVEVKFRFQKKTLKQIQTLCYSKSKPSGIISRMVVYTEAYYDADHVSSEVAIQIGFYKQKKSLFEVEFKSNTKF